MEDLFYKGNVQLCGKFQNSKMFPCVEPITEWLKKAVEKSPQFNLLKEEMGHGEENP